MAKTLLDGVNDVLKRVGLISGISGEIASLTDSAHQVAIDSAVQMWNEAIAELYTTSGEQFSNQSSESTITLLEGQRAYTLPTNMVRMEFPLIDKTNSQFIYEWEGEYQDFLISDPEQDDSGLPVWAVIRPTDGRLFLDREPTANDAGRVYTYQYERDLSLVLATDTMPFSDSVYVSMVPVVAEFYSKERKNSFDPDAVNRNFSRAGRQLRQVMPNTSYNPR